ncbi:MAG: class I SAM-dependent methyltransferase [Allosphingosinicella sp.]
MEGFGEEWAAFDQFELDEAEHKRLFDAYFSLFPFDELPGDAEGFDLGCGSGRWAVLAAKKVGTLHCIDPAEAALAVARRRLAADGNVKFHLAGVDSIPLPDDSQDFGYSLGVLHHIPDTEAAMRDCVAKLKPGAPFLVYLYYDFDNQPGWYRGLWRASDLVRRGIARLPFRARRTVTTAIAGLVYWPLARTAGVLERAGANVRSFPLGAYRDCSFYTMRTDALDRFGTLLEQRFSQAQIRAMMTRCGLTDIGFNDDVPYWVACGRKQVADTRSATGANR